MARTDIYNPSSDHQALRELVRTFAEREVEPQAHEFNAAERFNRPLFDRLGALGLLGITVDERFGGSGLDAVAAVIAHEELGAADAGFTLSYLAHAMLYANNVNVNANDDQRDRWLPGACSGAEIGGMCMSEPGAGTDVMGMRTTAVRRGDAYVLNGTKMWITNGAVSDTELGDVFLVYAKTEDAGGKALSSFLVRKGTPGFSLGQRLKDKLGMRSSPTAELVFEDVEIPAADRLGADGRATLCMMRNLELERLTLAAMSLGIARRAIEIMNRYASDRQSFGRPLRDYGQIQRHVAESYAEFMAGRAYVYSVAGQIDLTRAGNRVDSDGVKLYASTMAKNVADRAIQVLGGFGYMGEYTVERLWRDAKLLEIGGGTLEAHHKNMTRDLQSLERIR